jgi:hypothetical protein
MFRALVVGLALLLAPLGAFAQSVTLMWDAPVLNADGTPLTDLAGYRVYMAYEAIPDVGGTPMMVADVPASLLEAVVDVGSLPEPGAVVYFRATAYDTSGNESAFSNEVSRDFMPPVSITIRFQ